MNSNTRLGDRLLDIAAKHIIPTNDPLYSMIVFPEPYVPYMPPVWNGYLVLAESQNLGNPNDPYVKELEKKTPSQRMTRLGSISPGTVGVQPWDDCSLKLAVESALGIKSEETAVSNVVPWSQRAGKANINPSRWLQERAVDFWSEMFSVFRPKQLIVCGKVARIVMERVIKNVTKETSYVLPVIAWRHSSPKVICPVSRMFPDILKRYPEVAGVLDAHQEWEPQLKTYRQNKIFFACHAVSISGAK
ncbi:MAG: hypothetical protein GYA46_06980 [candidate division Zixibacteria bacterium]|nr:hypothetical protein [candidate division Zixibacteria bacterium]